MKLKLIIYIIFFLWPLNVSSQGLIVGTYHSDGSITTKDGEVIRKSYAERYQEAIKAFNSGEEIKDWPIVKKNKKGKTFGKKGFFGEAILEEGAPLLAIDKVTGSKDEILNNIAKQNGYVNEDILKLSLVANSSEKFQIENNINAESYNNLKNSYDSLVDAGIIGENFAGYDNITDVLSVLSGVDPSTGNAVLPSDNMEFEGELVSDEDIKIDGIDPGASLSEIAESLNLDSSLVTSRAMAETLSQMSESMSSELSTSSNAGPAIDPETGSAPLPPG